LAEGGDGHGGGDGGGGHDVAAEGPGLHGGYLRGAGGGRKAWGLLMNDGGPGGDGTSPPALKLRLPLTDEIWLGAAGWGG
jgi:hypothetical protein